ncbi:MAG: hypothetical protein LKH04_05400, partial [Lachnospiraceae bacterium]|nr:hypothetical protein [Lachnospiraceae bacterium]
QRRKELQMGILYLHQTLSSREFTMEVVVWNPSTRFFTNAIAYQPVFLLTPFLISSQSLLSGLFFAAQAAKNSKQHKQVEDNYHAE